MVNVSSILNSFSVALVYSSEVVLDGGFEDTNDNVEYNIRGVVQVPKDEVLSALGLDISIPYKQFHINTSWGVIPKTGDEIKYRNRNYKIVNIRDYSEYGYYDLVGEDKSDGGN